MEIAQTFKCNFRLSKDFERLLKTATRCVPNVKQLDAGGGITYGRQSVMDTSMQINNFDMLQNCNCPLSIIHHIMLSNCVFSLCLQCFDAVGWAAGRASGL